MVWGSEFRVQGLGKHSQTHPNDEVRVAGLAKGLPSMLPGRHLRRSGLGLKASCLSFFGGLGFRV